MKCHYLIPSLVLGLVIFSGNTYAASGDKVYSGSKKNIRVMAFKGTCQDAESPIIKLLQRIFDSGNKRPDIIQKFILDRLQNIPKCNLDRNIELSSGGVIEGIRPGQFIIAYKTDSGTNHFPAVCFKKIGQNIVLKTRKSEGARKIFKKAGDFGLRCEHLKLGETRQ